MKNKTLFYKPYTYYIPYTYTSYADTHHVMECQLEDGRVVEYDLCGNSRNCYDDIQQEKIYLGTGSIYSVNGHRQTYTKINHFWAWKDGANSRNYHRRVFAAQQKKKKRLKILANDLLQWADDYKRKSEGFRMNEPHYIVRPTFKQAWESRLEGVHWLPEMEKFVGARVIPYGQLQGIPTECYFLNCRDDAYQGIENFVFNAEWLVHENDYDEGSL